MKLDILFHYDVDPTTGEIKFIGKEEVTVDTGKKTASTSKASTSTAKEILGGDTPKLVLEDSKYLINPAAASALGVEAGEYDYTITTTGVEEPCENKSLPGTISISTNATLLVIR